MALKLLLDYMCPVQTEVGRLVDNFRQKEQMFMLRQPRPRHHQHDGDDDFHTKSRALPEPSIECLGGEVPSWWFRDFESVWRPLIQRLCRQKKVTLFEFERAASQVPALTPIEKTIAISAFRQQQA